MIAGPVMVPAMALPHNRAIKFEVFTLACHELQTRLGALRLATQAENRWSFREWIELFDQVTHDFFTHVSGADRDHSASLHAGSLAAAANMRRSAAPIAAGVFDELASAISTNVAHW